jgi:SAM-dependent methyltransferase
MSAAAEDRPFVYDEVAYPTPVLPILTPTRIRASGLIFGFRAAPCATASVLEIGCGDGLNLAGIAAVAPDSRCVGFDLSADAIARGRAFVETAGLANIDLRHGNIMDYPRDGEKFDYIITHGVYAWIPAPVRTALLELIAARLAPGGVAYVSYDCMPANAVKLAVNRFLIAHTAGITDPVKRIERAYELVGVLAANQHSGSRLKLQLDSLVEQMPHYDPGYFFHDFLAEFYGPVTVAEFGAAAAASGLTLAGDVGLTDIFIGDLEDRGRAMVEAAGADLIARASLLDMLRGGQTFRKSLLVRRDAPPPPADDRLADLTFAYLGNNETGTDEIGPFTKFYIGTDVYMIVRGTDDLAVVAALEKVAPNELSFDEVVAQSGLARETVLPILEKVVTLGLVTIHATPQNFVVVPGERPLAAPLVRAMMPLGDWSFTLRHAKLIAELEPTRIFLTLCDGTRTREDLAAAMSAHYGEAVPLERIDAVIADLGPRRVFCA